MFNLEQAIAEWRKQMLAAGIQAPMPLEELEIHLREEIERQMKLDLNKATAFEIAGRKIGDGRQLQNEFTKIEMKNWNHRLVWAAWILFVIAFFLPSYAGFTSGLSGWDCAKGSFGAFLDLLSGNLHEFNGDVHLALQTLPNLLLAVAPGWLWIFPRNARAMKFLRWSSVAAFILVWSFVARLLASSGDRHNLEIGCFVWAVSFLLFSVSAFPIGSRNAAVTKYV
jgi:hypothetical protein